MKKFNLFLVIIALVSYSCSSKINNEHYKNLIPTPTFLEKTEGSFEIKESTKIVVNENSGKAIDLLNKQLLTSTGFKLELVDSITQNSIIFKSQQDLGKEDYILEVNSQSITIIANNESGFFYGVQTLLQLLPAEIFSKTKVANLYCIVPSLLIKDSPKYAWRSFMLDSGRQFQTVEFIKRYLDLMAMMKLNVFHWHLTEGQGWRIEIKKYPKLTEIGSKVATGEEQQGYYSQEDVKEIIKYAEKLNITVVPEIDVPGHSEAALIAYPELTCFKKAPESIMRYTPNLFCGGNEATYTFVQDILDEVADLFPGEYIHLGGDEAPKDNWDKCPNCQAKIKKENLKDSHDLQLYFSMRLADYLKEKGKKVIFWGDVVYHDGKKLPDNVVVNWWNSRAHGDLAYNNAIKRGHPVIAGTNYYSYLNYPVTAWSQYDSVRTFDLKTAYENNNSDIQNPDDLLMGMGIYLWTDWYVKMDMVDKRVFPRVYAIVEQMWNKGERLPFDDFYSKVKNNYNRLEILGVDYGPALKLETPKDYNWE